MYKHGLNSYFHIRCRLKNLICQLSCQSCVYHRFCITKGEVMTDVLVCIDVFIELYIKIRPLLINLV
nr:MAG TPA: hypothetical protein [Bacteriophage sp.]